MDILSHYGLPPTQFSVDTYTLKDFLINLDNNKYKLPIIVNIIALNNYGRSIKNILIKNTPVLLLEFDQLDSVIADYYTAHDGRAPSQRSRLMLSQNKMISKSSSKMRNMKKLSRSVASLSLANQGASANDNEYLDDDDDENAYDLRAFIKLLNEKRSSYVSLCRIPTSYKSFFELLNADDRPIEAYNKLIDLPKIEYDDNDPEKRHEKIPLAVFLRSSCNAYTKKDTAEYLHSTTTDQNSNLTVSFDSCYGSSSDLDSQKNPVILNDNPKILSSGQTLIILEDCYAHRTQAANKEPKQQKSTTSSSSHFSLTSWTRATTKLFSSKKHRQANTTDNTSNEIMLNKFTAETCQHYVKCQTEQDDIVYISLHEPGLFSPLNRVTNNSKLKTRLNYIDTSDVFQLKDLLSHFRFPTTVRLLDGVVSFDNIYAPAVIHRDDTSSIIPTKFRLLGSHCERVVFACPLNKVALKASKTSLPFIVLPLSVNADIEIQPCTNMNHILNTDGFRKIIAGCSQKIKHYQTEITLVHFPLSLTIDTSQRKEALGRKRSQSESFTECFDEDFTQQFQESTERLNDQRRHSDEASYLTACSLQHQSSNETIKQKSSVDTIKQSQTSSKHTDYRMKLKDDKKKQYYRDTEHTLEDEIYEDVDKIYDFIRTGDPSDDVLKIQAKQQQYNSAQALNSTTKKFDQQCSTTGSIPGKTITHRFSPKLNVVNTSDPNLQFSPCKVDGNVDNEQAHALYVASKQRQQAASQQDLSTSKPIKKARRISKQ